VLVYFGHRRKRHTKSFARLVLSETGSDNEHEQTNKKVVGRAMRRETEQQLDELVEKSNTVFKLLKLVKKSKLLKEKDA